VRTQQFESRELEVLSPSVWTVSIERSIPGGSHLRPIYGSVGVAGMRMGTGDFRQGTLQDGVNVRVRPKVSKARRARRG
jgi:hypothetical protein